MPIGRVTSPPISPMPRALPPSSKRPTRNLPAAPCTPSSTTPECRPRPPFKERLGCLNGDLDAWRSVFELNLFAPLKLSRGFAAALHKGKGAIVNVTSHRRASHSPFRGIGLFDFEGGLVGADPRNGQRIRRSRRARQRGGSRRDRDRHDPAGIRASHPAHPPRPHGRTRGRGEIRLLSLLRRVVLRDGQRNLG